VLLQRERDHGTSTPASLTAIVAELTAGEDSNEDDAA